MRTQSLSLPVVGFHHRDETCSRAVAVARGLQQLALFIGAHRLFREYPQAENDALARLQNVVMEASHELSANWDAEPQTVKKLLEPTTLAPVLEKIGAIAPIVAEATADTISNLGEISRNANVPV